MVERWAYKMVCILVGLKAAWMVGQWGSCLARIGAFSMAYLLVQKVAAPRVENRVDE